MKFSKNPYICIYTHVYEHYIFLYIMYIYMLYIHFLYISYIHIDTQRCKLWFIPFRGYGWLASIWIYIYTIYTKFEYSYTCVYIHIYRFFENFIYSVYIHYIYKNCIYHIYRYTINIDFKECYLKNIGVYQFCNAQSCYSV